MARPGRRRKLRARHKCGKLVRVRRRRRLRPVTVDCPISLLLDRGLLTPPQHEAAIRFRVLHWSLFGRPVGTITRYSDAPRGRDLSSPDDEDDQVDRLSYERAREALTRVGALELVADLAVFLKPDDLIDGILRNDVTSQHVTHLAYIWLGCDALCGVLGP